MTTIINNELPRGITRDLDDSSSSSTFFFGSSSSSSSSWLLVLSSSSSHSSTSSESSLSSLSSSSSWILSSSSSSSSVSSLSSESSSSSSSSVSSLSSLSSSSSSYSSLSSTSSSSSSSNYGFLETPWDLSIASIDPLTRTIQLTWKWTTQDHWGDWVTPTGFVVRRKIGSEDFSVVTYSVLPNDPPSNEDYSYDDILSDNDAAKIFALGQSVTYGIKAYWVTA